MEDESAQPSPESQLSLEESMNQAMDRLETRNKELEGEMLLALGWSDSRALLFLAPLETQGTSPDDQTPNVRTYVVATSEGYQGLQIPDPEGKNQMPARRIQDMIEVIQDRPDHYRRPQVAGYSRVEGVPVLRLSQVTIDNQNGFNHLAWSDKFADIRLTFDVSAEQVSEAVRKSKDQAQQKIDERIRKEEEAKRPTNTARQVLQDLDNLLT